MKYNFMNSSTNTTVISAMELEVLICKHNNPVRLHDITENASTYKLSDDLSIAYDAAVIMSNIRNILADKCAAIEHRRHIDLINLHSALHEIVVGSDVVCCHA